MLTLSQRERDRLVVSRQVSDGLVRPKRGPSYVHHGAALPADAAILGGRGRWGERERSGLSIWARSCVMGSGSVRAEKPQDPGADRVLEALQKLVGEGGGFVEAEALVTGLAGS
jgi:nucleotide-binding universal stress UspA family protein